MADPPQAQALLAQVRRARHAQRIKLAQKDLHLLFGQSDMRKPAGALLQGNLFDHDVSVNIVVAAI